jgi:hypothetical protein
MCAWFAVMCRSVIVLPFDEVVKEGGRDPIETLPGGFRV